MAPASTDKENTSLSPPVSNSPVAAVPTARAALLPIESGWSSELSGGVGEGVVGADGGAPETRLPRALTFSSLYVPPVAGSEKVDADCV